MSPVLSKLLDTIAHLRAGGMDNGQIGAFVAQLVNGPILAAVVAATPARFDDLILGALKILFPLPAAPA